MKTQLKFAAAGAILAFAPTVVADTATTNGSDALIWQPSNGEVLDFLVLRQGNEFGYHTVTFETSGDQLRVENDIELEVKAGPFTLFYYGHESDEVWEDGELLSMTGETRKDGDDFTLSAMRENGELSVQGTNFSGNVRADIIPSSHWNVREVQSNQILSSEDGQLLDVAVEHLGQEKIEAGGETIVADRYRLQSDLTVDLWYDETGRWVKCVFEARGQSIEYVLQ